MGHPLPCCYGGCFSQLRTVRAASVHFPGVRLFLRQIYRARQSHLNIKDIDKNLSEANYESILAKIDINHFDELFKVDDIVVDHSAHFEYSETQLQVKHASVINIWLKELPYILE